MAQSIPSVVSVLLDSPLPQLDHLFDFAIPEHLRGKVEIGMRVRVPLRMTSRIVDAHVIELSEKSSFPGRLTNIESIVSHVCELPRDLYDLARRVADRQAGSASDVLRLAIPPRYVRVEKAYFAESAVAARSAARATRDELRASLIQELAPGHPFGDFTEGGCRSIVAVPGITRVGDDCVPSWTLELAQACAIALNAGESVVITVPTYREIDDVIRALTEHQLEGFVVRLDTRQSGGERYASYLRILEREPVVVIGNRSSAYAPAHNVGLYVVWDDGDSLMAEPHAPYAHARDIALVASSLRKARVALMSYVPSVEAQRLVSIGFASEWTPRRRLYGRVVPTDSFAQRDDRARIPSVVWTHIRNEAKVGPVLVQVARAGYAPALCCANCRTRATCVQCSGPLMTAHASAPPTCKWCGALNAPWSCPECRASKLSLLVAGSERTADELGRAFPNTKIVISDGTHPVTRVDDEPCLVISTPGSEPLTVNGYRSVVVLDGESHRSRAGLRVEEDAVRHWCGALSLARPEATSYLVGAGAQLGAYVAGWNLRGFAGDQLAARAALGLPPARRAASVFGERSLVESACSSVLGLARCRVIGPAPHGESSRAIILFDYRDGETITTALRASVVTSATARSRGRSDRDRHGRLIRLRVRLDEAELEDSSQ